MRNMLKPALALAAICIVVTLCLAVVNQLTKDVIVKRIESDAEFQRKQVINEAQRFEKLENWDKSTKNNQIIKGVYKALKDDKVIGFVFTAVPKGYAGEMVVTVGISKDGQVKGVKLGENKETPGLGTKASEPLFTNQFLNKKSGKSIEVVKRPVANEREIQAISGATITSRAVTEALMASAELADKLSLEWRDTK